MLSEAIYTLDQKEAHRLNAARKRNGLSGLSDDSQSKFIPRVIADACRIEENIDRALQTFQGRAHAEMGELLTPGTANAWVNLREHVRAGCLCDPPSIDLNTFGEPVVIGNEQFRPILRTKRGASALEGFHSHQKQWLGLRAQHSAEAGEALLADGALRWNRKRRNEAACNSSAVPLVFAGGLLKDVDDLHQRLAGESLYSEMSRSAASSLSGAGDVVLGGELEPNHNLTHATEQLPVVYIIIYANKHATQGIWSG